MVKILVVEDNEHLRGTLAGQLGLEPGFETVATATLADAREAFSRQPPDMVLLAASLPDGDGHGLCRWIRGKGHATPILMMTDGAGGREPVEELGAGADEYISKPLKLRELTGRIRAHLDKQRARGDDRTAVGPFVFSPGGRTLAHHANGETRTLTEKETAIFGYLAGRGGGTVGKEELLREVWGYDDRITTHTLETHIYRLRRKMGGMGETRVLLTEEGGYRLAT